MLKKLLVTCVAVTLFACGEDADTGMAAQAGATGQGGESAMGGADTSMGGADTAMGGDDTAMGGDDTAMGGDDTAMGGDDTAMGGDDTAMGGDDTAMGGDDTAMGGQESSIPAECAARYVNARDTGACLTDMDKLALCAAEDTIDDTIASCAGLEGPCTDDIASADVYPRCVAGCVGGEVGLSDGCATCFGQISKCTLDNCALFAIDMSEAGQVRLNECIAMNCDDAFAACAGISLNDR